MSWAQHHEDSERLAATAHLAMRQGDEPRAADLFRAAAEAEISAFNALETDKARTRGITAVSAVSLAYKAKDLSVAEGFAYRCLAAENLPDFAKHQIQSLLQSIWGEREIASVGLEFSRQEVFVSVRGGHVVTGGAPLDLILRKVEEVRALFYRTVEWLMEKPLRLRGGPTPEIQSLFRPWLFQAPPGSYQFAVRLESPKQMEFPIVTGKVPQVEEVTRTFMEILTASASDPEERLQQNVSDVAYRNAFLKLTRNLAPTGKSYDELEIRSNLRSAPEPVIFAAASRKVINEALRKQSPSSPAQSPEEEIKLEGILRAVHLDADWIEVTVSDPSERHIRVTRTGDVIDDVIGPMMNRPVIIDATQPTPGIYIFRDIQAAE